MGVNLKERAAKVAPTARADTARPVSMTPPALSPRSVRYEHSPPFFLVWAPLRYQTDAAGDVIPQLSKMPLEPGVNGVDKTGAWHIAAAEQHRLGRVLLTEDMCHAEDTPDGLPGYLRATDTATGDHHHTAWERLEVHAGRGRIVERDAAGYRAWLVALVARGDLPLMHPSVRRDLIERANASLDSASSRIGIGAERAVKLVTTQIKRLEADDEAA